MTDNSLMRLSRDKWLALFSGAYYFGCAVTGLLGLTTPTTVGRTMYSVAMLVFGLLAVLSVIAVARRSEAAMILAIAIMTFLHGALILNDGIQTALRVMIAPLVLIPFAVYRSQAVLFRRDVTAQIAAAQDDPRA